MYVEALKEARTKYQPKTEGLLSEEENMADVTVTVQNREGTGKGVSRKLRVQGWIPGIIYGKGKKNVSVSLNPEALKRALVDGGGINTLLKLTMEGAKGQTHTTLVKEIQKHPVSQRYLHVDFYEPDMTKKAVVAVPLAFVGKAEGLMQGGIVQPILREVRVKCLPDKIPHHIEVDITPLKVGDSLRMSHLKNTGDYEILFEKDDAIVTVAIPKEEAAPASAEAEAAAEGATPAAGEALKEGEAKAAPKEGETKGAEEKELPKKK